jgi:hypothetical protein
MPLLDKDHPKDTAASVPRIIKTLGVPSDGIDKVGYTQGLMYTPRGSLGNDISSARSEPIRMRNIEKFELLASGSRS